MSTKTTSNESAALAECKGDDLARPHPHVAIVHASVGSGHKAAAAAIADAFMRARGADGIPEDIVVDVLDVLDFGRVKFDGNKTAAAFTGATRPIYDITWRFTLTGRLLWGGGTAWTKVMFPSFSDYVEENKPIAVICTHITAANVAVGTKMLGSYSYPVVCVPTDYEIEGWWPHRETDLFCVASDFMAETLRPRNVPKEKIVVTGIPVRGGFEDPDFDKEATLRSFGLPHDKKIVLVMAGASLPQPYVRFREALEETFPYLRRFDDMHFVFLPGKDREYSKKLKTVFGAMSLENVSVLDYVDKMPELMRAASLAILKPGGLSVTECLCAHLPMLLLGKSYGQEKANTVMLTGFGASLHATTSRELITTLYRVQQRPESLAALLINASLLRRPDAADKIVLETMRLVKHGCPAGKRHFAEFYWGDKPAHVR